MGTNLTGLHPDEAETAVDESGRGDEEEDVHGVEARPSVVGLLHGGGSDDDALGGMKFI